MSNSTSDTTTSTTLRHFNFFELAIRTFCTAFILMFLSGCITVKVAPKEPEKAKDVKFSEPNSSFEKLSGVTSDVAWMNKKSGNIIAFNSECNGSNEATLEDLQAEAAKSFADQPVSSEPQTPQFDERESLRVQYEGKVDGILMAMDVLVYKKNSCDFILSLLGRKDLIAKDTKEFNHFLESFKSP